MHLPFFIAKRYFLARKSHNVINIISIVSAVGIAIGTMALVVILSVYNGFDSIIKGFYEDYQPSFVIEPSTGKSFLLDEQLLNALAESGGKFRAMEIVEDNVFVRYGENQSVAFVKGVDTSYARLSGIYENVTEGEFTLYFGESGQAIVGRTLASELRLRTRFLTPLELYFPDRNSEITPAMLAGPMGEALAVNALNEVTLYPSAIISLEQEFDAQGIFIPISKARELLGYSRNEVTSLELFPYFPASRKECEKVEKAVEQQLRRNIPDNLLIKNRYQQNETLYKLMKSEKFAVYLILFFVIIIISVNIFSSLSMLIIEKQPDIATFRALGISERMLGRVFVLQGWLISLSGAFAGILAGLLLCYIQKLTGIISMPGNYIVSSYPVVINYFDVLIIFSGVAIIGYIIANLPIRGMSQSVSENF